MGSPLVAFLLLASSGFFSVRDHAGYQDPEATLQQLVDSRHHRGDNHLCVIGYKLPDGDHIAWVYWPEDSAIILWEETKPGWDGPLAGSRRYLRLDKDVVTPANAAQAWSSTYLVTREWVNQTIDDCRAHGDTVVVRRHPPRH